MFHSFFAIVRNCICVIAFLISFTVHADVLLYSVDTLLNGTPPSNSGPWLTATFTDTGENKVQLKLSGSGLSTNQTVTQWYFNVNPTISPQSLNIKPVYVSSGTPVPDIKTSVKGFNLGNGGYYAIQITFPSSDSAQFTSNSTVLFDITSTDPLKASMFNFLTLPQNSQPSFYTAAQISGIGKNGTGNAVVVSSGGTTPVPEPSMYFIIGSFLLLGIYIRYRHSALSTR